MMYDEITTNPEPVIRLLETWLRTIENEWQTTELSTLVRETKALVEKLKHDASNPAGKHR